MSAKLSAPTKVPSAKDLRGILAYRLRSLRVEKGWSQERLAFETGLDRTYVSAVERCQWNVTLSSLESFAKALGVAPSMLLEPVAKAKA